MTSDSATRSPGLEPTHSIAQTSIRLVDSLAEVDGSGCGWRNWGKVVGIGWDSDDPAIKFSHSYLALQAAVDGVGIAMARRVLAADDFASGRLVRLARTCPSIPARFAYYFVTRDEPDVHGRALVSWLKAQLAAPRRPDLDT